MIEGPHDLKVLQVALKMAIRYTSNDLALHFYQEVLAKVERLQEQWRRRPGKRRRQPM